MLFNSLEYFLLLGVAVPAYWASRNLLLRNVILLVASAVFYCSWLPVAIALPLFLAAVNWVCAFRAAKGDRRAVVIAVVIDLATLFVFKYGGFTVANINALWQLAGNSAPFAVPSIVLPLGVSFFVFQIIAYTVDVRRGVVEPEHNLLHVVLFIIFFPHLIAGPICRPVQLIPQFKRLIRFSLDDCSHGILMLATGLFVKLAIADNLAPFVNEIYGDPGRAAGGDAILGTVAFGIQIFCDFWGYSTMALGSALLFGVKLPVNFDLPYLAASLQQFWRRWHITLSNWLRDYLYIPLGGSRRGEGRTAANLVIVMALGGLWHGANWTFVVWGLIHGVWLALERQWTKLLGQRVPAAARFPVVSSCCGWLVTMLVVFVGWTFFRAATIGDAATLLKSAFSSPLTTQAVDPKQAVAIMVLFAIVQVPVHALNTVRFAARVRLAERALASFWLILAAVVLSAEATHQFIYFQF